MKVGIATVAAIVAVAVSAVGGAFVAPAISAKLHPQKKAEASEGEESADKEDKEEGEEKGEDKEEKSEKGSKGTQALPKATLSLDSFLFDFHEAGQETHHLKLGLVLELSKEVPEEEEKKY